MKEKSRIKDCFFFFFLHGLAHTNKLIITLYDMLNGYKFMELIEGKY